MITKILSGITTLLFLGSAAWAQLVFEPQLARDIAFPDTPVGQTSEIRYTATSRGNGPWNVRLNTNIQQFVVNPNQFVVQNGQAVAFTLRFTPQQQGVVNGLLSGSYDNGNNPARVSCNLTGRGVQAGGARIAVDPDTLDLYIYTDELGTIWQSTEIAVTVSNPGNADLNVQSIADNADWLVCDQNAFAVHAGQSADVVFSVPQGAMDALAPDFYEATVTITSNAGNAQRLTIPVMFDRAFVPHYLVVIGDQEPATNHAILVDAAAIDGEELDEWDEIGVFTPRGDLAGAGPYELDWPVAFIVWGDDPEVDFAGLRQNESFDFRIWDASASSEYLAIANFIDGPTHFSADGVSEVTLTASPEIVDQVIALRQGWNLISLNVVPGARYFAGDPGPEIVPLFEDVRDKVVVVKDDRGLFYVPSRGFNGIPYLRFDRGLQVRVSQACDLIVRGTPIPDDAELALSAGWGIVGYYPKRVMTMAEAFEDLTRRGLLRLVKDEDGRFYLPDMGFGGNNPVRPGRGYVVNITENCTFRYPANQIAGMNEPESTDDDSTFHYRRPTPTSDNMSILITQVDGVQVRNNAEIACVTPDGYIAGASRLNGAPPWGMAVWADDAYTENIVDGFRDGEQLRFIYYDGRHQWDLEVSFDVLEGGNAVYRTNNLLVLGMHVGVEGESPALPTELALKPPFPNPFNATARFEFELPQAGQARLSLVDLNGREQMSIASGWFEAGAFSRTVDASALPAGVYLAVLETGGRRVVQRAVLLK